MGLTSGRYHTHVQINHRKSPLTHVIAESSQCLTFMYVVSLSSLWISGDKLTMLMGCVPACCIVFLEDLDAAFIHSVTHDLKGSNSTPESSNNNNNNEENTEQSVPTTSSNDHHRQQKENLLDVIMLSF